MRNQLIACLFLVSSCAWAQDGTVRPMAVPLTCATNDCQLLAGAPKTAGMRGDLVTVKAGSSMGWHNTNGNEETLIVLKGKGKLQIEGQDGLEFAAPMVIYMPPNTRHNLGASADENVVYFFVLAPAKQP